MRLSTREVNVHGRLTKSPSQLDWSKLASSANAWPPLLPDFAAETVAAIDCFVQGLICKRIEYRCGQLSPQQYLTAFLPQWTAMAEQRMELMEGFFAQHGTSLGEAVFERVFGAFERLQNALNDARQEGGVADDEHSDKKITFARPVAHRLIRRSRDRFSLRSVADVDESVESSVRLSCSPILDPSDTLNGSLQRPSLSPIPYGNFLAGDADGGDEERRLVLPVEDNPAEERFTGRASGVYYGDVVHAFRDAASTGAGPSSAGLDAPSSAGASTEKGTGHADVAAEWSVPQAQRAPAGVFRPPVLRSAAWRRWWIRLVYYVLVPGLMLLWLCWDRLCACFGGA